MSSPPVVINMTDDGQKQEYIYFFLQQIVDEEHGFLKLNILESTGPPENVADSTRGIQAWTILNDYYMNMRSARVQRLMGNIQKPQAPDERCVDYFTRIYNTSIELQKAGTILDDSIVKLYLFNGMLKQYRSQVTFIKSEASTMTIDDLVNKLTEICEGIENDQQLSAQSDPAPQAFNSFQPVRYQNQANFGNGMRDAIGHQMPPSSIQQPGTATSEVADHLRHFLHDNTGQLPIEAKSSLERAVAALSVLELTDQQDQAFMARRQIDMSRIRCHGCGQFGHFLRNCPNAGQVQPGNGMGRPAQMGGRPYPQQRPMRYMPQPTVGMQNVPPPPDMSGRPALRPGASSSNPQDPTNPAHAPSVHFASDAELYSCGEENFYNYDSVYCASDASGAVAESPFVFISGDNLKLAYPHRKQPEEDTTEWNSVTLNMPHVQKLDIVPFSKHYSDPMVIPHLFEVCAGGTVPGLRSLLKSGYTILKYTYADSDIGAHHIAEYALTSLQRDFPDQLPPSATSHWDCIEQNVNLLSASDLPEPVSIGWFTPPCTPFSSAGPCLGWKHVDAKAFISCVSLINDLYKKQNGKFSYLLENVPGAGKFMAIREALGQPVLLSATKLGSSASRLTAVWTNAIDHVMLHSQYNATKIPGLPIPAFLNHNGFSAHYSPSDPNKIFFDKFVSRHGSWRYSIQPNGAPARSMLVKHDDDGSRTFVEPTPEMRELAMGMPMGYTDAPMVSESLRMKVLGACMDHNVASFIVDTIRDNTDNVDRFWSGVRKSVYNKNNRYRLYSKSGKWDDDNYTGYHGSDNEIRNYLDTFIVDTGATKHITGHKSDFTDYTLLENPQQIHGIDMEAVGYGTILMYLPTSSGPKLCKIQNVLHVPSLLHSDGPVTRLFSPQASQNSPGNDGPTYISSRHESYIQFKDFRVDLDRVTHPNLLTLKCDIVVNESDAKPESVEIAMLTDTGSNKHFAYKSVTPFVWHLRSGHVSSDRLRRLVTDSHGVQFTNNKLPFCTDCALTKSVRQPSGKGTSHRPDVPFLKIGTDIWSTTETSLNGYKYMIAFTCYSTGYVVIYLMRTKDESPLYLDQYLRWVSMQNYYVQEIRGDSDAVFMGQDFRAIAGQHDVTLTFSAPYTPTENPISERTWGVLVPAAKAMMKTAELPLSYWEFAVQTACYLHNRIYSRGVDGVPLTLVTGLKPRLAHLRVFGCPAFVHVPAHQRKKL